MTTLYDSYVNVENLVYTVESIEQFQVVPMEGGRHYFAVAKVQLTPHYTSDVFSAKNVVELESDIDDRRN